MYKENQMKRINLSLLAMIIVNTSLIAGGAETPVTEPVVPMPVVANQSAFYLGLGLSAVSTREGSLDFFDVTKGQDRTGDIVLLGGYEFNPYIAIEARYMDSIAQEDILERSSWGIFAKPQYPVTETINLYALLGYGGFKASQTDSYPIDVDDTGFQWGLGASYDVTENISVFADYINIANDVSETSFITSPADVSSDALTVGVFYKF